MRIPSQLVENERPTQALFHIIIIEEAFKRGTDTEDGLTTLSKKCCLFLNKVKIWISHLQKKKENHAKAVQKAKETSMEETKMISTETNISYTHVFLK